MILQHKIHENKLFSRFHSHIDVYHQMDLDWMEILPEK